MAKPAGAVVLVQGRRDWPAELVAMIAREGYTLVRADDVRLVPFFVLAGGVTAVLVDLAGIEMLGVVALRRCRECSPSTSIVVVAYEPTTSLMKRALDSGASALLSWPAPPEVVARVLRGRAD